MESFYLFALLIDGVYKEVGWCAGIKQGLINEVGVNLLSVRGLSITDLVLLWTVKRGSPENAHFKDYENPFPYALHKIITA